MRCSHRQPVVPRRLLAIEDGLDWPTGRSWDHLGRWGTEPLEEAESLPPDLAAAVRAEARLDGEGQRLFGPPSVPDVLAALAADRRLDEAGRCWWRCSRAWSPARTGMPPTRSPSSWWTPNRASRRAFSSPKHGRSHDDHTMTD